MNRSVHDTIDLEEELGDIDEVLAEGSLEVASSARRAGAIEWVLVGIANAIWAVVGLVLWLPQTVRAVLGAALRVVHSALTEQSSDRAVAGITRVSRSYVDRFLRRQGREARVGRRHELRPLRLLGEVLWTVGFYLLLLRWLAPDRFAPVWDGILDLARGARSWGGARLEAAWSWLTIDLAAIDPSWLRVGGALLATAGVGLLIGYWLGRRRG